MEKHYVFLKANRVEQIAVFAKQDDDLATRICIEHDFDKFIWLDEARTPLKNSIYDKTKNIFIPPLSEFTPFEIITEPVK